MTKTPLHVVRRRLAGRAPAKPVVALHPLLGTGASWSRHLDRAEAHARRASEWDVAAPDLRNHGESPWRASHSYAGMVRDVVEMMRREEGLRDGAFFVAHSMGGKVAMLMALLHPRLVRGLLVVDAAPAAYTHSHGALVDAMAAADVAAARSPREVTLALRAAGADAASAAYAVEQNLRPAAAAAAVAGDGGGFRWTANLEALRRDERLVQGWPLEEVAAAEGAEPRPYQGPAAFVGGTHGRLGVPEYLADLPRLFPRLAGGAPVVLPGGHFVHNQRPAEFADMLVDAVETTT